jgi:ABC-2 type transport system ATP-binding protein
MLVTIKDLTKQYKGHTAVNHISFSIKRGSCIALLGPNGAGKTTTLQMLAGLLTQDTGSIQFTGDSGKDHRSRIGFLPQHPSFFNWMTAKEYLQFAGNLSRVPKKELSSRINETLIFVGLDKVKNKKIGGFSGGMQQRLGLAQALLHQPELLILDEPVSALDPMGRRDVLDLIGKLKHQMTILFSTHILHDAEQVCKEVLMMKEGELIWNGTLETLRKEFDTFGVKLQTEEPIKEFLDNVLDLKQVEYLDLHTARIRLRDKEEKRKLLQEVIRYKRTLVQFETMQDSLEDAYMKVMQK